MAAHVYPFNDAYGIGYDFVTYTGVMFSEMDGSGKETGSATGGAVTRIYRTPWLTRRGFINTLLGGTFAAGFGFYRLPPARDVDWFWMYCTNFTLEPFGRIYKGDQNQAVYKKGCIINATFETPTAENQADEPSGSGGSPEAEIALATESGDFSAQFLTQEGKGYYVDDDLGDRHTLPNSKEIGILAAQEEYVYVRHIVANLPRETIANFAGTVNGTTFAGRVAERLLFIGAQYRRVTTTTGTKAYEITYKFVDRLVKTQRALIAGSDIRAAGIYAGWNRDWVATVNNYIVNDWIKLKAHGTNKPKYELSEFRGLFDPLAT